jgi:hypothetical protein
MKGHKGGGPLNSRTQGHIPRHSARRACKNRGPGGDLPGKSGFDPLFSPQAGKGDVLPRGDIRPRRAFRRQRRWTTGSRSNAPRHETLEGVLPRCRSGLGRYTLRSRRSRNAGAFRWASQEASQEAWQEGRISRWSGCDAVAGGGFRRRFLRTAVRCWGGAWTSFCWQ